MVEGVREVRLVRVRVHDPSRRTVPRLPPCPHNWVEQLERLLTVVVLLVLGGAIVRGLLNALQPIDIAVVAVFLLLIRPLTCWPALAGGRTGPRERLVIAFFGVRGIGSLFYIAYALGHGPLRPARPAMGHRRPHRRRLRAPPRHHRHARQDPARPRPPTSSQSSARKYGRRPNTAV